MCESNVWARYPNGESEKIADDVLYITQEGEEVVLRWFLKEPLRVAGRIVSVDAVKHVVTLESPESVRQGAAQMKSSVSSATHEAEHGHSRDHPHDHSHHH